MARPTVEAESRSLVQSLFGRSGLYVLGSCQPLLCLQHEKTQENCTGPIGVAHWMHMYHLPTVDVLFEHFCDINMDWNVPACYFSYSHICSPFFSPIKKSQETQGTNQTVFHDQRSVLYGTPFQHT